MKNIKPLHPLTLLLTVAICAATALAQDAATPAKPAKPDDAAMMTAMMQNAQPGENHKLLQELAGTWTYKLKYWMSPDTNTPPIETGGTTTAKTIMDGRYLVSEHKGSMMGGEFEGIGTEGYDNGKKKFVSSWIDNTGTGIEMAEGTYDPATKTLTYLSEYEYLPGLKVKHRQTTVFQDKDHHTMKIFETRKGVEFLSVEIVSTRIK